MRFRTDVAMTAFYFSGLGFFASCLIALYTLWCARDVGNPDWLSAAPRDMLWLAKWSGAILALSVAATWLAIRQGLATFQECLDFLFPGKSRGRTSTWVSLPCGGRIDCRTGQEAKGPAVCTKGCRHARAEVDAARGDLLADAERRTSLEWIVGAPLLVLALAFRLLAHSKLQDKILDSGVPGEAGFLGESLGHFHFWNRDWSGAELILIYSCLALLYLMLGGPLPKVRRRGASPADRAARRPGKPTK